MFGKRVLRTIAMVCMFGKRVLRTIAMVCMCGKRVFGTIAMVCMCGKRVFGTIAMVCICGKRVLGNTFWVPGLQQPMLGTFTKNNLVARRYFRTMLELFGLPKHKKMNLLFLSALNQ
ncbi:MAG: hypothetical protein QNJ97_21120 [Myxococcota bacterium]|nr:hypothetical protein [Myxococcota bacterium]